MKVVNVRCDYRENPLGIDNVSPLLSWTVESSVRGVQLESFRVLVASSPALLDKDTGDLWDSGMISSPGSLSIRYPGPPLASMMRCWWKVMVQSSTGQCSAWSENAFWETGLLTAADWHGAQWIGLKPTCGNERSVLGKAHWISSSHPAAENPDGLLYFRIEIQVPHNFQVHRAQLHIAADGNVHSFANDAHYQAWVDGASRETWRALATVQSPSVWDMTGAFMAESSHSLVLCCSAGNNKALIAVLQIHSPNGECIEVSTGPHWRATACSEPKIIDALTALKESGAWSEAITLGAFGSGPWQPDSPHRKIDTFVRPPYLRKTFTINKPVASARLYACAAGIYEARVNGTKAGDHLLAPGWTDYRRRTAYQTHDVTALINQGTNVIGAIVADGWYCGNTGFWKVYRNVYGYEKAFIALLHCTFTDGSTMVVTTGPGWKGSSGAIRSADLFDGEVQDARFEQHNWDRCGFDDSRWKEAITIDRTPTTLIAQSEPPVRKTMELAPVSITRMRDCHIIDFGQNISGWVRVELLAPTGTEIAVRHGELLCADGSLYTGNLGRAHAQDRYICCNNAIETFEPRFTIHGFRYAEVQGCAGELTKEQIRAVVVHSDLPASGAFACSDSMLNQLHSNIVWGQRGNFVSIPTDCPQRSERIGWTADIQVFAGTALYNADCGTFLQKWLDDLCAIQRHDGAVYDVAPAIEGLSAAGNYGWGDAVVVVPWKLYVEYADRSLLERYYPHMARWTDYLASTVSGGLRKGGGWSDWLSPQPQASSGILATAYFAFTCSTMARIANILGRNEDKTRFSELYTCVKAAFLRSYVHFDGTIENDTQTMYAAAILFGLYDEGQFGRIVERFCASIERADYHLSTGFLGTPLLLPALVKAGRTDLAFKLLTTDTYPSWGFAVKNGATTIWERWNPATSDDGVMAKFSLNHYAFGAVGEWMYQVIAGLVPDPEHPGYRHFFIKPVPGGGITSARLEHQSVRGPISIQWTLESGVFSLAISVPPGSEATVTIPASSPHSVTESGKPIAEVDHCRVLASSVGCTIVKVKSGTYAFSADYSDTVGSAVPPPEAGSSAQA